VLALLFGGFIFPWAKGTRQHKIFGYAYAAGRNDGHDRFRLPSAPFWPAVAIGSAMFFGAGGLLIARMTERTLAKVRDRAVRPLF
jgi:hypothetical protein